MIDPSQVWQEHMPDVWDVVPKEILEQFRGRWLFTPQQLEQKAHILANRWYLLTNGHGVRCSRCGAVHTYHTKYCIEWPLPASKSFKLETYTSVTERGAIHGARVVATDESYVHVAMGEPVPISQGDARRYLARIKQAESRQRIVTQLRSVTVR